MKRLIVLLVVIICTTFTITVLGQDQFESGHLTPNSNWNNGYGMTQMPSGSGKFLYEGTSPGTGNRYFRLWYSVGPTKYGPSGTSDVQINMNTETALTNWNSSAGKAYYFATTNAYKYIIKSNGNNSMNVICFEIQGAVQSVSTVTRSVASPTNVDVVTVTATLGAAFNTGQAAYLRYTTNAWGSSTVVPMTGSGTTYTANIPAQTGGTTVSYNVFTSGSASGVSTNLTTTPSKSDWYTININNNSGSNYSYTVTTSCSTGTWMGTTSSDWNTASNWGCSILPTSSTNVTIPSGTTYSPVISTGSTALANSITINSGATLTISGTTNLNITSGGTITNNGTFTSSTCPSATVTFLGSGTIGGSSVCTFPNLTLTGTVTLNNNINVTGNFTSAAQKVNNGKTVTFNGNCAGAQTIARTGGGTEYFTAMVIDKSAGSLTLSSSPATNVILDDPMINNGSGTTLTIKNVGTLDVNGQSFTITGGGGGGSVPRAAILVDGASGGVTKTIKSSIADGYFYVRGTFKAGIAGVEVNTLNNGKLLFDNYVNVNTNIGFAPTDKTTIGYKLELLGVSAYNGGFVADINNTNSANGHPIYAIGSTLIYNNVVGVPFGRNREWDASGVGTAGVTPGYPYNVLIKGNSKVDIGINTTSGIDNRAIANDLTIEAGSALDMNVMDQTGHHLTIGRDLTFAGSLILGHGTTTNNPYVGDILVGRNWTRIGATSIFNPNESGTGYTAANKQTVISDVTSNIKARAVTFFGTDTSIITAPVGTTRDINGGFDGETFPYLKVNKTNSTNVVSNGNTPITITRVLSLIKGSLNLGDSNFVIASNLYRTADIAAINPSNVTINYNNAGRFVVQRFIYNQSTQRSWRFLTAPLQATDPITINDAWQEGVVNAVKTNPAVSNPWPSKAGSWCGLSAWPGFGTHITGPGGIYDGTKGFDQGTNTHSIQYFDNSGATSAWVCPANTKSTTLMSKSAWGLFVRGDRGFVIGDQYVPAATTILEPKGKINIGDVTTTVASGKTNLVGNPYASQINMTNVSVGGLTKQNFKLWDPKAFTNYTNTGKYIPFTWISGTTYAASNSPVTTWTTPGTVESSQAFFVTPASSTVVFHESDKVSEKSTMNGIQSRPMQPSSEDVVSFFRTNLSFETTPNEFTMIDGTLNLYNSSYNTHVDSYEDVVSPVGSQTGALRIIKEGQQLAISKEQPILTNDTVYYYLSKLRVAKHLLTFSFTDFLPESKAVLYDLYKNDSLEVLVSNTETTNYLFDITSDAASNRSDRFKLVFKPESTLPVKIINANISYTSETKTKIAWDVAEQTNVSQYIIEKSMNGTVFSEVGVLYAIANNNIYSWIDIDGNPFERVYYRICIVDISGSKTYSRVLTTQVISGNDFVRTYPNPVKGNNFAIQLNGLTKGDYVLRLMNAQGQQTLVNKYNFNDGTNTTTINLPSTISKGTYFLEVYSNSELKGRCSVVVE